MSVDQGVEQMGMAYDRRVNRPLPIWARALIDVFILAVMFSAALTRKGHSSGLSVELVILIVCSWLPLLARRRWPLAALVAVVAVECCHLVLLSFSGAQPASPAAPIAMGAYQPVPIATLVAAWTVARHRRPQAGLIAGVAAAAALLLTALLAQPLFLVSTDVVMVSVVLIATAIGVLLNMRGDLAARRVRERHARINEEVVAERLRIARELHDVLTHRLTLVNAQASVAEYLLHSDPAAASKALNDISVNTRQALDELRATVGLLRSEGEQDASGDEAEARRPTPGLDQIAGLVEGYRAAGMRVSLTVLGPSQPLVSGGGLAAYRIVEESLTNVTKHAPGARAVVTLEWLDGKLDVSILNGRVAPSRPHHASAELHAGVGHGIIGMRERAESCGGTLSAHAVQDGGFIVVASIPTAAQTSDAGVEAKQL